MGIWNLDVQLVHLELQNAAGDAQRVRRLGLIPAMALEGFAEDIRLEASHGLFEAALALAPLFAKRLGLARAADRDR